MALDVNFTGTSIDASNNVKVILPTTPTQVGNVRIMSENDDGTLMGVPKLMSPETSSDYRLRVGIDTILFTDTFNSTLQNTNNWAYSSSTLTCTQTGGFLIFGANGTTTGHGAFMRTFQYFPIIGTAPLSLEFTGGVFGSQLVANEMFAAGFGLPSGAGTTPTDAVYLKLTTAGLTGVIVYNGVSAETTPLVTSLTLGAVAKFTIIVKEGGAEFWIDDILAGNLEAPNGQPLMQGSAPVFMQKICTGTVSNTNTIRISDITVCLEDIATNKDWETQLAGQGLSGNLGQNGGIMGKTAIWNNSAPPTAVALTNTTAAFTGLGGRVAFLPTLIANTDGILMSYLNPVAATTITGRNLIIKSVKISSVVSVVFAGGPTVFEWALAFGHTAVSLATAETVSFISGTTHAPRIIPLGIDSFPVTAAVGSMGLNPGPTERYFDVPVVVRPGEYVAITCTNMGTVTTTGAVTTLISFDAYWE